MGLPSTHLNKSENLGINLCFFLFFPPQHSVSASPVGSISKIYQIHLLLIYMPSTIPTCNKIQTSYHILQGPATLVSFSKLSSVFFLGFIHSDILVHCFLFRNTFSSISSYLVASFVPLGWCLKCPILRKALPTNPVKCSSPRIILHHTSMFHSIFHCLWLSCLLSGLSPPPECKLLRAGEGLCFFMCCIPNTEPFNQRRQDKWMNKRFHFILTLFLVMSW